MPISPIELFLIQQIFEFRVKNMGRLSFPLVNVHLFTDSLPKVNEYFSNSYNMTINLPCQLHIINLYYPKQMKLYALPYFLFGKNTKSRP